MIFSEENYRFMYTALELAQQAFDENEVPVGALVVKNGAIIGKGYNQVERLKDATAHAEMIALTSAASTIGEKYLNQCELYVTLEPCIMCSGALLLSRIGTIYYAAHDSKFGAAGSLHNLLEHGKYNHTPRLFSGLMEYESKQLLVSFFEKLRF